MGVVDIQKSPSGKAELAIYSYSVCVKGNIVVIIFINKMDFADKANFPRPNHAYNTMCLILNISLTLCVCNYWHCSNDQTTQDS